MPTFKFSKLVRDKIINLQIADGITPVYRQLDIESHRRELIKKLSEEAQEIADAPISELASEIADVQQVLEDLCELYGISITEVTELQRRKQSKNGAFKQGYYIDHIKVDEDNQWVPYYRTHADRYPETP